MADTDFTLLSTEESRAGALACMKALQAIEIISEKDGHSPELSMEAWWRVKETADGIMIQAAGEQSVFMSGFIAVLAEYVFKINVAGTPDLNAWKPEASMTAEEKAARRAEFGKIVEDADKGRTGDIDRINESTELAYKEASDLAKRWNDGLPASAQDFKKRSAWLIGEMLENHFNDGVGSKRGGYSFDKETVREFDRAVDALCNILIAGKVKFSQFEQDQQRRNHVADAFNRGRCLAFTGYERDRLVQRFMNELNAPVVSDAEIAIA